MLSFYAPFLLNKFCFMYLYDIRMVPRPLTWPPMTLAARSSSTTRSFTRLFLVIRPRSSPLPLRSALLSRHLRGRCLRLSCPYAHIISSLTSSEPQHLLARHFSTGHEMPSSSSLQPQPRPSTYWTRTIVLATSWSSWRWRCHATSQCTLPTFALLMRHMLGCAQWSQQR